MLLGLKLQPAPIRYSTGKLAKVFCKDFSGVSIFDIFATKSFFVFVFLCSIAIPYYHDLVVYVA